MDEIKAALNKVAAEHAGGPGLYDNEWTRRIKEELGALGKSKGYYTYGLKNSPHCHDGEFMFDLCWLDYGEEDKWLKQVPLVLESEWLRPGDVDDDFQKLLIARAGLRVMVFGAKTREEFSSTVDRLRRWVNEFEATVSSDQFLLCGWCSDTSSFRYAEIV
ncbi:MAG: hypothetical protein ACFCUW_14195 [Kiloniellaceae bacterium]